MPGHCVFPPAWRGCTAGSNRRGIAATLVAAVSTRVRPACWPIRSRPGSGTAGWRSPAQHRGPRRGVFPLRRCGHCSSGYRPGATGRADSHCRGLLAHIRAGPPAGRCALQRCGPGSGAPSPRGCHVRSALAGSPWPRPRLWLPGTPMPGNNAVRRRPGIAGPGWRTALWRLPSGPAPPACAHRSGAGACRRGIS